MAERYPTAVQQEIRKIEEWITEALKGGKVGPLHQVALIDKADRIFVTNLTDDALERLFPRSVHRVTSRIISVRYGEEKQAVEELAQLLSNKGAKQVTIILDDVSDLGRQFYIEYAENPVIREWALKSGGKETAELVLLKQAGRINLKSIFGGVSKGLGTLSVLFNPVGLIEVMADTDSSVVYRSDPYDMIDLESFFTKSFSGPAFSDLFQTFVKKEKVYKSQNILKRYCFNRTVLDIDRRSIIFGMTPYGNNTGVLVCSNINELNYDGRDYDLINNKITYLVPGTDQKVEWSWQNGVWKKTEGTEIIFSMDKSEANGLLYSGEFELNWVCDVGASGCISDSNGKAIEGFRIHEEYKPSGKEPQIITLL